MTEIRVSASGPLWVGAGVGSVESAIHQIVVQANNHILITAYSVTSGASSLLDDIHRALQAGVLIKMLVNRLDCQSADAVTLLRGLSAQYPHFQLWNFEPPESADLHAKLVSADENVALVGSSNLSFRGLVSNYEIGVVVRGEPARLISRKIRELLSSDFALKV